MSELQSAIRRRAATRAKLTKSINKSEELIQSEDQQQEAQIPALIRILKTTKEALNKQNDEVISEMPEEEMDADIEAALDYELKVETTIDALEKLLTTKAKEDQPANYEMVQIMKQQTKLTDVLSRNQERAMLPRREPEVFDGKDLTKFKPFLNSFERSVESRTDNDSDKLLYLEQYTSGMARELVRSCTHMTPSKGFQTAMKALQQKYGDEFAIANSFLEKIEEWPNIKQEDGTALEKFSVFLTSCMYYMEDVSALNQLHSPKEIQGVVQKLPYKLREKWRNRVGSIRENGGHVTFKELVTFVESQSKLINMPIFGDLADGHKRTEKNATMKFTKPPTRSSSYGKSISLVTGTARFSSGSSKGNAFPTPTENNPIARCSLCQETNHAVSDCMAFREKSMDERKTFIKKNNLCFGCLSPGHHSKGCSKRLTCDVCNRRHPTCLHENRPSTEAAVTTSVPSTESKNCRTGAGDAKRIALALIPIKIRVKGSRESVVTYAGLDNYSSDCFITDEVIDKLGISGVATQIKLTTMEKKQSPTTTRAMHNLEITDLEENESVLLPVTYSRQELPISREDIPKKEEIENWPHLSDLPFEFVNAEVGLLIGVNVPDAIRPLEVVHGAHGEPYATKHKLGWAVNGPMCHAFGTEIKVYRTEVQTFEDIEEKLNLMYSHDYRDYGLDGMGPSIEDKLWETKVKLGRFSNGHYEIPLPFRKEVPEFPDNRKQALQRLQLTRKRLQKDPAFYQDYANFMHKMLDEGYMEPVPLEQTEVPPGNSWYISHHGVYNKEKKKIRVVFDCSLKYQGTSLNSELLQGPDLTNNLIGVLLRFREGCFAFTGDVEKMFYQVKIPSHQADWLRLLWFPEGNLDCEPCEYRLKVHVFGAVSSPSCSNYALRQTVLDGRNEFPEAVANTILRNFYVDDVLKSTEEEDEAIELLQQVKDACSKGGFNLTKLIGNSLKIMKSITEKDRATEIEELNLDCEDAPFQRALGVKWKIQTDTLAFKINLQVQPTTRRGILSVIFSIYDPLGLVGPALLPAKMVFQELSRLKLEWDEPIPEELAEMWNKWISELPLLADYEVQRCIQSVVFKSIRRVIHIFCDGSESGYGAVAYLRCEGKGGEISCSLIFAKSRLSPLKKMTIPRIELTAAKLSVVILGVLKQELQLDIEQYVFWTDSTTVLKYLNNPTKRFQRFVANRVAYIQEHSDIRQWRYVPSKENPADYASRGLSISKFVELRDWKHGPEFLWRDEDSWPKVFSNNLIDDNDVEVKKHQIKVCRSEVQEDAIAKLLNSSSDWYVLRRRVAWILRLKKCLKTKTKLRSPLTLKELEDSQNAILSYVQRTSFASEIRAIEKGKSLEKKSSLYRLNPIIDSDGLLRVGGRISRSDISENARHPLLIPKNSHVGNLIVQSVHLRLGCMGKQFILSKLREKFWIIGANQVVKKMVRNCFFCRKRQGKPSCPFMSDLPADRLQGDQPPFTKVGIDCFGPFLVTRGRGSEKRYGVIFICLSSLAIHLEMAHSLDTSAFINTLRRFIARRGQVKEIRSDNGTNFTAADHELREEIRSWNQNVVTDALLQRDIQWSFNPPSASHFGGIWERQIRTIRKILSGLMKEQPMRLSDDLLNTLLCEVEAILNSRPLTSVSDDPCDLESLTPNHILMTKAGPTFPPGLFSKEEVYARRRWKQVQYLADLFWKRWRKEYLTDLQRRQKWNVEQPPHAVGDLVLMMDGTLPRNQWPLGRILEVLPDEDGRIRVVKVRTVNRKEMRDGTHHGSKFSDFVRPVSKVILLKSVNDL